MVSALPSRFEALDSGPGLDRGPYTSVEVIFTIDPGDQGIGVIGGTGVARPMFSALWALASQKAQHPLGLAAARVYSLPLNAITDVVPQGSFFDPYGPIKIHETPGVT